MKPRHLLISLAAVLALALAGCGGGGDETTDTAPVTTEETTTLTKDELIAQGDGICAEVNAAVGSVGASESDTGNDATQVADLYGGMVERIKGLGTPDDATGYEEFIDAADELAQAESDLALAAERGDEAGIAEAESDASSALSSFQTAASSYGFEDCSEGPSAPVAPVGGVEAGGEEEVEVAPEEVAPEEVAPEEAAPEEAAPETGGAGGGTGTGGETGGGETGAGGGIGPG